MTDESKYKECHFCGGSTDEIKTALIDALRETDGNVSQATKKVRINRASFYTWRKADEKFNQDVKDLGVLQDDNSD